MKMADWDTASFNNFKEVIKYFKLEENFITHFNVEVEAFVINEEDKYEENKLINHCLNWIEDEPFVIWFSGYNEETREFDVSKMFIDPKNVDDAKKMVEYLNVWIYKNY
jgi:hypothetical protein